MRLAGLLLLLLLTSCGVQRALSPSSARDRAKIERLRSDLGDRSIHVVDAPGTSPSIAGRVARKLDELGFTASGGGDAWGDGSLVVEVAGLRGGPLKATGGWAGLLPIPIPVGSERLRLRVTDDGARSTWHEARTLGATVYRPSALLLTLFPGWNGWSLYHPGHWSDQSAENLALSIVRGLDALR